MSVNRYSSVAVDRECPWSEPKYYLHGFGDASKRAYCAVVYLVTIIGSKTCVKLLASKTRVAPIKVLSIPRLELMAARILAQCIQ